MERKNVEIPAQDLARQRDFEERIREMFSARQVHPVACVDTFGCQQNVADGERLMGMLEACGFTFTQEPGQADLVILNTCAVREHAEQRVFRQPGHADPHQEGQSRPGDCAVRLYGSGARVASG